MKIIVEQDATRWDWFHAELLDPPQPAGLRVRASASGDAAFIFRVVADWIREYR